MPSETHRDFFRRRTTQQTPFRESSRAPDCTEPPYRRFPSRAYSSADLPPQPSANKEQSLRAYERKKFVHGLATVVAAVRAVPEKVCGVLGIISVRNLKIGILAQGKHDHAMKVVAIIARVLLGLIFVVFGSN